MPKRDVVTTISFTDQDWNELTNLYTQLDQIMGETQYPTVTESGLSSLIANLEATLKTLKNTV
jgi:hypothetical protein